MSQEDQNTIEEMQEIGECMGELGNIVDRLCVQIRFEKFNQRETEKIHDKFIAELDDKTQALENQHQELKEKKRKRKEQIVAFLSME